MSEAAILETLKRIADALERLSPIAEAPADLNTADAWIWNGVRFNLEPVITLPALPLSLLQGLEHVRDILLANTRQFSNGLPANNALLWGARGMGKSSLVKSVFQEIAAAQPGVLKLIEIHREEVGTLPRLLSLLAQDKTHRFILFCDDLSFDAEDEGYKSLKAVLDGSIAGRPDNVILYATSNRRHLMPRDMIENERKTAIHPGESVEEKVSLSDRFGLWLGFYACDQDTYLAMVDAYAAHFRLGTPKGNIHAQAIEWAATRGARSGRVAWQFITDLAGKQGKNL